MKTDNTCSDLNADQLAILLNLPLEDEDKKDEDKKDKDKKDKKITKKRIKISDYES
jgi:hypothetical protein